MNNMKYLKEKFTAEHEAEGTKPHAKKHRAQKHKMVENHPVKQNIHHMIKKHKKSHHDDGGY